MDKKSLLRYHKKEKYFYTFFFCHIEYIETFFVIFPLAKILCVGVLPIHCSQSKLIPRDF